MPFRLAKQQLEETLPNHQDQPKVWHTTKNSRMQTNLDPNRARLVDQSTFHWTFLSIDS